MKKLTAMLLALMMVLSLAACSGAGGTKDQATGNPDSTQGIDKSCFEAATIDGAGRWQTFSKITMPLLRPIMLYVAVTSLIGGLQLFDLPYLLSGAKGTLGRSLYTAVFYILEAPRIDGASKIKIFHRTVLPIMAPGIAPTPI